MHPLILAVYRRSNSSDSSDFKYWEKGKGLLVPMKERKSGNWVPGTAIAHGTNGWAESESRPGKRLLMVFDAPSGEFVFPEVFRSLSLHRRLEAVAQRVEKKILIDIAFRARQRASLPLAASG
ncbi:MAG TPA: hypothetical protein VFT82_01215 [Candidatus Paceibacterota bacterium]|nr:hypothetical protein [Candidatus Paceibacterota bacterium]